MARLVGKQYTYKDGDDLVKVVMQYMESFKKSVGYYPTMIKIREEEYDPNEHKFPLRVIVVNKSIIPHSFVLYPVVERTPIKVIRRNPCL